MRNQPNLASHLAVAASITLACCAAVADDGRTCTAATLSGSYVFRATGWGMPLGVWAPKAIVELIRFNGDETLTVPAATVANRAGDVRWSASQRHQRLQPHQRLHRHADIPQRTLSTSSPRRRATTLMIQTNPNNVLQGSVKRISKPSGGLPRPSS
jgi:hypothetical protein